MAAGSMVHHGLLLNIEQILKPAAFEKAKGYITIVALMPISGDQPDRCHTGSIATVVTATSPLG